MSQSLQAETFQAFGASSEEVEELFGYDEKIYKPDALHGVALPLDDEPFVEIWQSWAEETRSSEALTVLANHLPQLHFPITEGISQTVPYRQATLSGVDPREIPEATGLHFEHPETVELEIYPSFAGGIPVFVPVASAGTFDADGIRSLGGPAPNDPTIFGVPLQLQAFAIGAGGNLISSNSETMEIR